MKKYLDEVNASERMEHSADAARAVREYLTGLGFNLNTLPDIGLIEDIGKIYSGALNYLKDK